MASRSQRKELVTEHRRKQILDAALAVFSRKGYGQATIPDIAREGGGIVSTVRATRAADEAQLVEQSAPRLRSLLTEGVTTVEIKSGYGLELETEARMLRAARRLEAEHPVTVSTTLLAAHALPPEFAGRADDYIEMICNEWLPRFRPLPGERGRLA